MTCFPNRFTRLIHKTFHISHGGLNTLFNFLIWICVCAISTKYTIEFKYFNLPWTQVLIASVQQNVGLNNCVFINIFGKQRFGSKKELLKDMLVQKRNVGPKRFGFTILFGPNTSFGSGIMVGGSEEGRGSGDFSFSFQKHRNIYL